MILSSVTLISVIYDTDTDLTSNQTVIPVGPAQMLRPYLQQRPQVTYLPSKHFSIQYSCIRLSPLNSGWKDVTSFLPFFTITFPRSSARGSPSGESEGANAG
jgi:hypothetical protein